jgi:hypothetical protein
MSNASMSLRATRRESINLLTLAIDLITGFAAAVRCANALETRRKPAAKDLDKLGLRNLL